MSDHNLWLLLRSVRLFRRRVQKSIDECVLVLTHTDTSGFNFDQVSERTRAMAIFARREGILAAIRQAEKEIRAVLAGPSEQRGSAFVRLYGRTWDLMLDLMEEMEE
jgi:hypothetical protein